MSTEQTTDSRGLIDPVAAYEQHSKEAREHYQRLAQATPPSGQRETIEDLRDELAKQILRLAIASDNPQYKVDAFKATERYGKTAAKTATEEPAAGGMAAFHARVRQAQLVEPKELNGDAG